MKTSNRKPLDPQPMLLTVPRIPKPTASEAVRAAGIRHLLNWLAENRPVSKGGTK